MTLPASIIRKESVEIQELLNANAENLRNYFRSMVSLINELSVLGRMLSARKAAVLRSINRDITAEETVIATTQRELDKINRILHPIMYNNRLRTISTAAESLDQYRRIRDEVEANEDYFGKLQSIADNINRLNALLSLSKQDIDRPSSELMYKATALRDVYVNDSLSLVEEIFTLEDPYTQYAAGLSNAAMELTPYIDAVKAVADPVLEYEYYGKIEKRNAYLKLLAEHMEEDLYDNVMNGQGIRKNGKGEYPIYTFTPYLKLQIRCKVQGTPNQGTETLIAIDEAQNLAVRLLLDSLWIIHWKIIAFTMNILLY